MGQIIGVEVIRSNWYMVLVSLFCIIGCSSPKPVESGPACCIESYLKENGDGHISPLLLKPVDNRYNIDGKELRLSKSISLNNRELFHENIQNWLEQVSIDSIKVYHLFFQNQSYVFISSKVVAATGLAANFCTWCVVNASSDKIIAVDLLSLTGSQNSIYVAKNRLRFVTFDFDDQFFEKPDFDEPLIIATRWLVAEDQISKGDEARITCKCK